jgi:hypothetical protein
MAKIEITKTELVWPTSGSSSRSPDAYLERLAGETERDGGVSTQ